MFINGKMKNKKVIFIIVQYYLFSIFNYNKCSKCFLFN